MRIDEVRRVARRHAGEGDLPAAVVHRAPESHGRVVAAEVLQVRRHGVVAVGDAFHRGQRAGADGLAALWFWLVSRTKGGGEVS